MVIRLVLCLFAAFWLHSAIGARISDCDFRGTLVEGNNDFRLYCAVDSTATVRWTAVTKSGATQSLGICYGGYNCTASRDIYRVHHYGSTAEIRVFDVDFKAVECQETLTNGTVLSDTCQLNYTRVSFGVIRQYDIQENSSSIIHCKTSAVTNSTQTWNLITDSGQTLYLGTCYYRGSCTSPLSPDFTLMFGVITVQHIARKYGGNLLCSFDYNGDYETDSVTLNVYNPATVSNCHAELLPHNWSAILSCDVSNVFSSAGVYDFSLSVGFQVLMDHAYVPAGGELFEGRRSYRYVLTPYTNNTNNKVYYKGRLVYSWPLPPMRGFFSVLSVDIYYGYTGTYTRVDFAAKMKPPSQPTHNCSNIMYFPETGVVPCVCTADSLGSPPGRLLWLLGNITIASGDYGVTQLQFPSGRVGKEHDGISVTCYLDWIQPISAASNRLVIYRSEQTTAKTYRVEAIGLGTVLGVVVPAFVVVMVVLCRRGRLCQRGDREGPWPKTEDNEDTNYYTSLNLSQVATTARKGEQQGVSCPPAVYQAEDKSESQNTDDHGSHM